MIRLIVVLDISHPSIQPSHQTYRLDCSKLFFMVTYTIYIARKDHLSHMNGDVYIIHSGREASQEVDLRRWMRLRFSKERKTRFANLVDDGDDSDGGGANDMV